ncbi:hypothetical protein ACFQ58_08785 [Agromyces sp. NPDC056523]|uniref:hypothetical protein n=1 Tax=Agromyces sp. NPDC056523 TaxID=3345850 RepID=UPI00366DBBFA
MGNAQDNVKNGLAAAITVAGIVTGGPAPAPNTSQLADAQGIAQERNKPGRGDVTGKPTTSGKP